MMFPSFMSICVVHGAMLPILKIIEDYRWTPIPADKPHHTYLAPQAHAHKMSLIIIWKLMFLLALSNNNMKITLSVSHSSRLSPMAILLPFMIYISPHLLIFSRMTCMVMEPNVLQGLNNWKIILEIELIETATFCSDSCVKIVVICSSTIRSKSYFIVYTFCTWTTQLMPTIWCQLIVMALLDRHQIHIKTDKDTQLKHTYKYLLCYKLKLL